MKLAIVALGLVLAGVLFLALRSGDPSVAGAVALAPVVTERAAAVDLAGPDGDASSVRRVEEAPVADARTVLAPAPPAKASSTASAKLAVAVEVVDAHGTAVHGVEVMLKGAGGQFRALVATAVTDDEGRASLAYDPTALREGLVHTVSARGAFAEALEVAVALVPPPSEPVRLVLPASSALDVLVLDGARTPIAGAEVVVARANALHTSYGRLFEDDGATRAVTGADGVVRIPVVQADVDAVVAAREPGGTGDVIRIVRTAREGGVERVELAFAETDLVIEGRLDRGGAAEDHAWAYTLVKMDLGKHVAVVARATDGSSMTTRGVAADGSFFVDAADGEFRVAIAALWSGRVIAEWPEALAPAGEGERYPFLAFDLADTARLVTVRTTDPDGAPVPSKAREDDSPHEGDRAPHRDPATEHVLLLDRQAHDVRFEAVGWRSVVVEGLADDREVRFEERPIAVTLHWAAAPPFDPAVRVRVFALADDDHGGFGAFDPDRLRPALDDQGFARLEVPHAGRYLVNVGIESALGGGMMWSTPGYEPFAIDVQDAGPQHFELPWDPALLLERLARWRARRER